MTERRAVIVTGAASGIGRAIAERLEHDGMHVLAVDLEPDPTARACRTPPTSPRARATAAPSRRRWSASAASTRSSPTPACSTSRPSRRSPRTSGTRIARAPAHEPVPARQARLAGAARERRRALHRDRLGARACRVAVQVGLRVGQARRARARQDARAGGRRRRHRRRRRLPGLRAHAAGGAPDRRPGQGARAPRGARARGGHPRAARDQAADRARGGRGGRRVPRSARAGARSPASR